MRRSDKSFDPFSESPVDGVIAAHCSIQVGYRQVFPAVTSFCRRANTGSVVKKLLLFFHTRRTF